MIPDLIQALIGVIIGIVLDWWLRPVLQRWFQQVEITLARGRYKLTRMPDPPKGFVNYRLGNVEIPVMNLFGSPETPFRMEEVRIEFEPILFHQKPDYPVALAAAKPFLERVYCERYNLKEQDISRMTVPRLSGYKQAFETAEDARGGLTLSFNLSTFDTFLATNRSLDYAVIPQSGPLSRLTRNQTIREAYVRFPYSLEESVLANNPGALAILISRNLDQNPKDQVIIQLRSKRVLLYRNCYQASAAGYMSQAHMGPSKAPHPFVTAWEETYQEVSDALKLQLQPEDFHLIGLALSWQDMEPFFYGYFETGRPVQELLGDFRRDEYEGWLEAIPFDPKSVLSHLAHHKWTPEGAIAMCATLLAFFPRDEVETIASQIPAKAARDFYEFD